jgi:hypothetical protein
MLRPYNLSVFYANNLNVVLQRHIVGDMITLKCIFM